MQKSMIARTIGLAIALLSLSVLVSGCFQTAGAALEATQTPAGGAVVIIPTEVVALPTAITPDVPVANTTQLAFATPTETPTLEGFATETPFVEATFTPQESETPLPTFTLPPILTPTPIEIAQIDTAGTATQNALNIQATDIIATVTQAAAFQQTQIATLQGTGMPFDPNQPPTAVPPPPVLPTGPFIPVYVTATPNGTPGVPGSGAAGYLGADCNYYVVEGDRLIRIALRFNTTPEAIARANGLVNPDLIVPGQLLRIPTCFLTPIPTQIIVVGQGQTGGGATGGAYLPTTGGGGCRYNYVVQEGDTLYSVASRYRVPVMSVASANGISNLSLVYIGQNLCIP